MDHLVVLGGGQAGARAAQAARDAGHAGRISVVSEEPYAPYQRPPLSKAVLLSEGADQRSVALNPDSYYAEARIDLLPGTRASRIDTRERRVLLADGRALDYDALVLALGARPRPLQVPGAELAGVHYLRTVGDALALRADLRPGRRVAIVGGGFIGLEVAASAVARGCSVTVIEGSDRLMGRSVAPEVGAWFLQLHRGRGVEVRLCAGVSRFEGTSRVGAAVLQDGSRITVDTVVVGIGIVPNQEIAAEAGLACDNGILVDNGCRTSVPGIFAAGDVCRQPHPSLPLPVRLESYQNAQDQGTAAGRAAAGQPVNYVDRLWVWSDQYEVNLQLLGMPQRYDGLVRRTGASESQFTVFYLREGCIVGANLVNSGRDLRMIERLMHGRMPVDPARLADPQVKYRDLEK